MHLEIICWKKDSGLLDLMNEVCSCMISLHHFSLLLQALLICVQHRTNELQDGQSLKSNSFCVLHITKSMAGPMMLLILDIFPSKKNLMRFRIDMFIESAIQSHPVVVRKQPLSNWVVFHHVYNRKIQKNSLH